MARVTVEDCILEVPNRFELVALASQRAKSIAAGAQLTVDRDNDKNAVVALREIAEKTVPVTALREQVVQNLQRRGRPDILEHEETDADLQAMTNAEIADEVHSLTTAEDDDFEDSGMSFSDDNLDVED